MRRIYSAVLVAYNDSAWLAALTARKVLGFCLTAIKDWHGRHSYLLQPTKVNLLAHAKSVTPPAPIFRWSSKSWSKVTTKILKRSIELGSATARKIQFEGSKRREGVQHRLPSLAFESRGHAARLLKFAHPPNLWGISLTDYTWRSRVVQTWLQATKALSAGF